MIIEWNLILRLLIAGLLGGLVGLERMIRAKEVGVRTHFVVALGSALFMLISQYAFDGRFDSARVAAQVVSGIGFLGAGVIIFQKNVIRGITTAAALWVTAAIGLAAGAGMYAVAIASALMTVLCLELMHLLTDRLGEKTMDVTFTPADSTRMLEVMNRLREAGFAIESFSSQEGAARLVIRYRQKDYPRILHEVLVLGEGLRVDIS